jgi:hypothetical protein
VFNDSLGTLYAMHSDGLGPYVDGTQNVKAIIDCSGDFDLDTSASASQSVYRHVWVDLTGCVPGFTCTPPYQAAFEDVYFSTGNCGPAGCNLLGLQPGQSEQVAVHVGAGYTLTFNPKEYAETSTVTVIRTQSGGWTIQALPDSITGAYPIAKLVQRVGNGPKTTYIDHGDYYVTFQINVALK